MTTVVLSEHFAIEGGPLRSVVLREITGEEELGATSPGDLVRALVVGGSAAVEDLTVSDQDIVLAAIYRDLYGSLIECHVPCRACDRRFEMSFEIDDWIGELAGRDGPEVRALGRDVFGIEAAGLFEPVHFRIPNDADLAAVSGDTEARRVEALRRRCVVQGDPDDPRLEAAMARAGPLLDDDIDAECAYCGQPQKVPFRLADYLLATLARERPILLREVHHLASAYHWSRAEILSIPRSMRRDHVRLVLADTAVARTSWR